MPHRAGIKVWCENVREAHRTMLSLLAALKLHLWQWALCTFHHHCLRTEQQQPSRAGHVPAPGRSVCGFSWGQRDWAARFTFSQPYHVLPLSFLSPYFLQRAFTLIHTEVFILYFCGSKTCLIISHLRCLLQIHFLGSCFNPESESLDRVS